MILLENEEYFQLLSKANAKEKELSLEVNKRVEKATTHDVHLDFSMGEGYDAELSFEVSSMWDERGDQCISITKENKQKICDFLEEKTMAYMTKKFGMQIGSRNYYVSMIKKMWLSEAFYISLSISGWFLAAACIVWQFLK